METKQEDQDFKPVDFVYCGRRLDSKGGVLIAVRFIIDGKLQPESLYDYNRKNARSLGCIYSGALLSSTHVKGMNVAKFSGARWNDDDLQTSWRAQDELAEATKRLATLEAESAKVNEVEKEMLRLRKLYAGYRSRNDYAGIEALERLVSRVLRTPPRQSEK